jgi:hypothetical protein
MSADRLRPYLELAGICPRPVFIIGSPRSGTTALAHALNRHPELWASKESYFLHQLYGNGRAGEVWERNTTRATPSWIRHEGVEREEFLGFLGLGINALYSSRSDGRRWVDQTPIYTSMVHDLAHMFPGAQFLHMLRDGRAVVRSMSNFAAAFDEAQRAKLTHELPRWTDDFRDACATWREWVETALGFAAAHPQRCLTIRNEELATDPQGGFARIEAFLGIARHGGPAEAFAGPRVNSSFRRAPVRPGDGAWDDWPADNRRSFVEIAGPALVATGYATADELDAWVAAAAQGVT